jgi:hypothetical protein
LTVRLTVGVCVAAVLIGRSARQPEPASDPWPGATVYESPRYCAYDGLLFSSERHPPRLLDRETGVVATLTLSGTELFEHLDCSPWHDEAGHFCLVGRWVRRRGGGSQALALAVGLAWCRFPGGTIVDRMTLDPVPSSNPCWYPDGSGRVLFAEGGQLYSVAFQGKDTAAGTGSEEARQPRPLNWRVGPPGRGVDFIHDLHWPSDGALALRCLVLASLTVLEPGASTLGREERLWWLDLGRDGTEIEAAGPVIVPDPAEALPPRAQERFPVLGTTQDGKATLAYLAREHDCALWDLWLTPIASRPAGTARSLTSSAGRRVARNCLAAVPTFSADGRWIYVFRRSPGDAPRLERFPVAPRDDPADARLSAAARLSAGAGGGG